MNIVTKKNAFENNEETKGKVIQRAWLANRILEEGGDDVRIIAMKQDRNNPDSMVAVFRDDEKFQDIFKTVLRDTKMARFEAAVNREVEARLNAEKESMGQED